MMQASFAAFSITKAKLFCQENIFLVIQAGVFILEGWRDFGYRD